MDYKKLISVADQLDEKGLEVEANLLDEFIKSAAEKQAMHKCGLKESTVSAHQTLMEGYQKALKHFEKEYDKVMLSSNEVDSPNMGALREILSNSMYNCNAVHLHQMYFDDVVNSKPYPLEKTPVMEQLLDDLYKTKKAGFLHEIKRAACVPRNGWVLLSFCTVQKTLFLDICDLHSTGGSINSVPVLALDMWEHAYFADFGLDKEAYVDWFLSKVDWRNIAKRVRNLQRLR